MIGVEHVLDLELPVPVEGVTVHAGVECQFAVRGAIDQIVDVVFHRTDMIFEAHAFGSEARKYEAAVVTDARCAGKPKRFLVETFAATFRYRHGREASVGVK